jgi:ABC-type sugar transport system ATPase subunit
VLGSEEGVSVSEIEHGFADAPPQWSASAPPPLLNATQICKRFPGVVALDQVDFEVRQGEIHALLGENGAGKSTLIKLITGLTQPDEGGLFVKGRQVQIASPRDARRLGISVVPQDVMMVSGLSVGRNMLLGLEQPMCAYGSLKRAEAEIVERALEMVGAKFSPSTLASSLSVPDLRLAQIARTLIHPGSIVVMDEPTAVLSEPDAERLLERLLSFREQGKAIIYVSHRLSEVMRIADRATVLRDGRRVAQFGRGDFDRQQIVAVMARAEQRPTSIAVASQTSDSTANDSIGSEDTVLLRVTKLSSHGRYSDVSLSARAGEIVGIAGVQGSGHGYFVRALAGADPWDAGAVTICGRDSPRGSVRAAFHRGLAFIPADRRRSAIVTSLSIQENLALSRRVRANCRRFGFRWPARERAMAEQLASDLSIHPPILDALAGTLSGGNQQKLALARVVEGDSRVLLIEEPTQGVDIRSKAEIHTLLRNVAKHQRRAVVIASSEFEELVDIADVIHVMCLGRLVATFPRNEANYHTILHHALP